MILAHSLDGLLRIRQLSKNSMVVETRSPTIPGYWIFCVWKSLPPTRAWELFNGQTIHHADPSKYLTPVVKPGE